MKTRLSKKRREQKEKSTNDWTLNAIFTSYIFSFIPFVQRSAIFLSCKEFSQVCFDDFWSSRIKVNDYLTYVLFPCRSFYKSDFDLNMRKVFESGNINEIKLFCSFGICSVIEDYLKFVPSNSFLKVLKCALSKTGISRHIFKKVAIQCFLEGNDEIFDSIVSYGLFGCDMWFHAYYFLLDAAYGNNIRIVSSLVNNFHFDSELLSLAVFDACCSHIPDSSRFNFPLSNNTNVDGLAVIKFLVSKGADINFRKDDNSSFPSRITHYSPLLYAFKKGDLEIIEYLLENGADPAEEHRGTDILKMACFSGSAKVVKRALQLQPNLIRAAHGVFYLGEVPLFVKIGEKDILEIYRLLFEAGARIDGKDYETIKLIVRSCKLGFPEVIKLFVAHGADYNLLYLRSIMEASDCPMHYYHIPLYAAVRLKNVEVVKFLVSHLKLDINQVHGTLYSPVVYAAKIVKSKEMTKLLLDLGATVKDNEWDIINNIMGSPPE